MSPLVRGAALPSESCPSPKGGRSSPPAPWALTASFLYWRSWASKRIGSTSALSGFPLKFVKQSRQHWQPLMITPSPTDAMGDSSLFFVLASLGRRKFGRASALSGFPLEFFLRGRTKQRRQPFTVTVGRVVDSPVGGYVGGLLVVPLSLCPGCCLGVADSATGPLQAAPILGVRRVALLVGVPAVAGPRSGSRHALSPVVDLLSTASAAGAMGFCRKFRTPARTVRVQATGVPTIPSWLGPRPLPPLADSSSVGLSPPRPSSSRVLTVVPSLLSVGLLVGVVSWRQSLARSAGLFRRSP